MTATGIMRCQSQALTPIIRASRPKIILTAVLRFVARIKPALRSAEVHFGHTRNTTNLLRLPIVALMLRAVTQKVNT